MQPSDRTIFADVSDIFELSNPAIVEKDYYVVQLLKLMSPLTFECHNMVFSGGTALAKANIKLQRMSEDVDIKLVVGPNAAGKSKNAMKEMRKAIKGFLVELINNTGCLQVDPGAIVCRDEHRYIEIPVQYPQAYNQAPCLRPYIKLELIETGLLAGYTNMSICSLHNEAQNMKPEVPAFNTVPLISTQAEKVLSMLRRTASVSRDPSRLDDASLVRHIYDTHRLQQTQPSDPVELANLIASGMRMDRDRYGRQHKEFADNPLAEMRYGLAVIAGGPLYRQRYEAFVGPMVYGDALPWDVAFATFSNVANQALDYIEQHGLI
ncbi:nucleotidyl transferase AbiEii/AbiGii toxin family protein [Aeromonas dhakensis]|uniref:nucleotidyl transferase AbiEii/AbiGii toxin family protein n=1 Tax=Aeromonas dhakensis TaxID=196024 RepID=UPI003985DB80